MTITPRRVLFWMHLIAGCIAGTVIFFLSITGAAIAYERQAVAWADRDYRVTAGSTRLPVDTLMEQAAAYHHHPIFSVAVHSDPAAPVEIQTLDKGNAETLLLNPYTGAVIGQSAPRLHAYFDQVKSLHRWFGMQGENRTTARMIKGAFTLSFVFLICSGIVLWIPRKLSANHINRALLLRRDLKGRARDWNLHTVIGAWIAPPVFLIALTGTIMAFPWANDLLFRITGNTPPPRQNEVREHGRGPHGDRREGRMGGGDHHVTAAVTNFDPAFSLAEARVPGWRTVSLRLSAPAPNIVLQVDRGDGGRPDLKTQVTFDAASNRLLKVEDFSNSNLGRKLRMWARFTHTGEAGGLWGETIAVIACMGAALLVWTGFSLSGRRFLAWRKRKQRHAMAAAGESFTLKA